MSNPIERRITFEQLRQQFDVRIIKEILLSELFRLAALRAFSDNEIIKRFDEVRYMLVLMMIHEKAPNAVFGDEVLNSQVAIQLPEPIPEENLHQPQAAVEQEIRPSIVSAQHVEEVPKERDLKLKKSSVPNPQKHGTKKSSNNGKAHSKKKIDDYDEDSPIGPEDIEDEDITSDEIFFNIPYVSDHFSELDDENLQRDEDDPLFDRSQAIQEFIASNDGNDTVGIALREMGSTPLLSYEEEQAIGRRLETGRAAQKILDDLKTQEGFNEQDAYEEIKRFQDAIADKAEAEDHLARANARLVISIAKKYIGRGVPFLDLIQEGMIGLMHSIQMFNPSYNQENPLKFSTYATWWIRQRVGRAVQDQSRTVRIPIHKWWFLKKINDINYELNQRLGNDPTFEQIATEMLTKYPTDEIKALTGTDDPAFAQTYEKELKKMISKVTITRLEFRYAQSIHEPVGDDDTELGDLLADNNENNVTVEEQATQNDLKRLIEQAFAKLPSREAYILRLRFGLTDGESHTLEQISDLFGLTRERVRQLEIQALNRLRNSSASLLLGEYLS